MKLVKSIIYILLAQTIPLVDLCIFVPIREILKRNPSALLFGVSNSIPMLLIGAFLALANINGIEKKYRFIIGVSLVSVNLLLFVLQIRGYISIALKPYFSLLAGYGIGTLLKL